jgi:putative flippase GtrA
VLTQVKCRGGTLKFFRYSPVGGAATFLHYLVLVLLVEGAGVLPWVAATGGATCGALLGYAGNRRFTFDSSAEHRQALPRYLLIAALGALANGAIVWTGTEHLHWHYVVAQMMATSLILATGFSLNRRWTFA